MRKRALYSLNGIFGGHIMRYALLSYFTTKNLESLSGWRKKLDETLRRCALEVNLGTYVFDLEAHENEYYSACFKLESHNCPFCVVPFSNPEHCLVVTKTMSLKLLQMGLRNERLPVQRSILQRHYEV